LRARQFKARSLEVIGSRGREKQQLESPAPQVFEKQFEVLRSILDEQVSLLTTIHQAWEVLVKGLEGAYFEPCDDARLIIEKFDRAANQIINLSERPQEFSNPSSPEARAVNLSTELSMYELEFASIFPSSPGVECPLSASIVRIALESLSAILHEKFRLMALARH
jgi:hypothetical protein